MPRYDIAIIGTGPGGVSAAITSKIRNKSILLIGSKSLSSKLVKAHAIHNYPGFPGVSGADLASALKAHLDSMEISITEDRIASIYAMGDYFALQGGKEIYESSTVILASGVVAGKPLPGEEKLLGRGVSYCATCDAPLYRGKSAAVIGYSKSEEAEARFLSEICSEVLYFPMYRDTPDLPESVQVIRDIVTSIDEKDGKRLVVTKENAYPADGVFVLRESISPGQLVPGLELVDGNFIKVDRTMCTSIPGCFACGDVVGQPFQYIKAAGEGNIAALSAVSYLDKK
ncbi:MAG: NAD(P)/FAD-dependent oxidoreductase [Clostridia bacterium]|nr:NAD(P)/FAD-dependent oxidoreductase [Clostridia bacterium]